MAGFDWSLESARDQEASDQEASDQESRGTKAAEPATTSRRALREQEAAASASRVRSLKAPRALKEPRARAPKTRAPKTRAPKKTSPRVVASRPSVPHASAVRTTPVRPPVSRPAPRRGQLLRKFITISAMFGAGALLVATSLPAVALQMNSASALTPELPTTSNSQVQSLVVDGAAADAAPTRDPYTVVNTIQQARMKFGLQNFSYSNDTNGTIQWPFPSPVPISSGFGARVSPCGGCSSFHEGVDFIPGVGTPIGAIADGTVTYAAYDGNFGYHVIIDHNINGQKVQSLYAHMLAGSIKVVVGQQVTVTQELGQVGSTGHSTGAHLHLEVHLDGTPVDPFAWLKANAN
ncbi:MAG: peptidoglycan DD-metalloendopeptidase family protein [Kineosporiaceae bacterium]|nr:peptidoglycan DD-metalloendopeptidase family protein [Aeromicrobium sp.]